MLDKDLKELMDIGLIAPTYYYTSDLYISNINDKTFKEEIDFIIDAITLIVNKMIDIELLDIDYVFDNDVEYSPKEYGHNIIIDLYFKSKVDPIQIYDIFHSEVDINLSQKFPYLVNKDYFHNYNFLGDFGALGHIFLAEEKPY